MSRPEERGEEGFTLVEMLMTTAILLIVLAIVLPLVYGSLNSFTNTAVRSDAVDNAQLALGQIDHDVESANLLYVVGTGASQVVHIETYSAGGVGTCVEYQVLYPAAGQPQEGALQRRTMVPGAAWPAGTAGWGNVMTGIVNSTEPTSPAVFALSSATQYQSLAVDLWVQLDTRAAPTQAAPENFTSTFTGTAIPAGAAAFATTTSEPC